MLELPNKGDKILDLQWEPHGNRFAVLHGEGPRPNFSLYGMKDTRTAAKVVQLLGTQTGKQATCIFWSPQARAPSTALLPCDSRPCYDTSGVVSGMCEGFECSCMKKSFYGSGLCFRILGRDSMCAHGRASSWCWAASRA